MSATYTVSPSSSPLQPPVLELEDGEGACVLGEVGQRKEGKGREGRGGSAVFSNFFKGGKVEDSRNWVCKPGCITYLCHCPVCTSSASHSIPGPRQAHALGNSFVLPPTCVVGVNEL